MPRPLAGDDPPPESARIKQSILADYVDLVLRIKQARAIIAWHMMRPPIDGGRAALRAVDDVLATDPVGSNSWTGAVIATSPGPFPAEHTHTPGDPAPWDVPDDGDDDGTRTGPPTGASLTGQEREVLAGVAAGAGNIEIGRKMHLSPETVKSHLNRMSRKLGAHGRRDLLAKAYRTGLIRNRRRRDTGQ